MKELIPMWDRFLLVALYVVTHVVVAKNFYQYSKDCEDFDPILACTFSPVLAIGLVCGAVFLVVLFIVSALHWIALGTFDAAWFLDFVKEWYPI